MSATTPSTINTAPAIVIGFISEPSITRGEAGGVCTRAHRPRAVRAYDGSRSKKEIPMLSTLIIVLLVLWLLGVVTSYTLGGFIHILLVMAIIVVLLRVIQGRNPIRG
jgi:hypothetical protein